MPVNALHRIEEGLRASLHGIDHGATVEVAGYSTEAQAIFAAFTTAPTTARENLIDACVVSLKSAGVWTKLDTLYAFAAADSQAAKINWKAPGTFNCTEVNAPVFTADTGYNVTTAGMRLDTNFNPSTASTPKYVLNSATVFGWSVVDVDQLGPLIDGEDGSVVTALFVKYGGTVYWGVNQAGYDTISNSDATGLWSASRTGAATNILYRNGASFDTKTSASTSLPNIVINFFHRPPGDYWTGQIAGGGIGQSLNSTEQTALYNALRTYMTGVGVP